VARKDDMIKTKGERVSSKEIENCLCELEGILEGVRIAGVKADLFGPNQSEMPNKRRS
jgi:acyl-coenzyme A synthetase/AMP-(fatty) acid ligase